MACERTYRSDGSYYGAALSRRRAEWHGTENNSSASGGNAGKEKLVNTFVPWRAIFCSASIRGAGDGGEGDPRKQHADEGAVEERGQSGIEVSGSSSFPPRFLSFLGGGETEVEVVASPSAMEADTYFVLEYGPSGALLETKLERTSTGADANNADAVQRGGIALTTEEGASAEMKGSAGPPADEIAPKQELQDQNAQPRPRRLCLQYVILDSAEKVLRWWEVNGKYVSHDQFFPPKLRMGGKLPDTLVERRTKMAQYDGKK